MGNETETARRGVGRSPMARAGGAPLSPPGTRAELLAFTWKLLIVIGAAAVVYAAASGVHVLLLIFTGMLFAIFLLRIAGYIQRWAHLPHGAAVAIVLLGLFGAVAAGSWLLSRMALAEFGKLTEALTNAYNALPEEVRSQLSQGTDFAQWIGRLRSLVPPVLFSLADALIIIFTGIYFAISPDVYKRGLVLLVPPRGHERAREVLHVIGEALWLWMIGQFCAMALVGILTALGLWLLGMPVPIQLGIIAGLLEFMPYVGPILSAAPAVLIAFSQSPQQAMWVILLYIAIHQFEGHVIQPQVQRAAVDLPPVVTIGAIAFGGYLFGLLGIMIATPLVVCILVCVNMLYLADRLGEGRHFPTEEKVPEAEANT
ncbi:MAG: AI-2E family transporter [Acetobacteraceae bacterium]|nr:AI-2E family transporter [Acetobacteraceae bacterium]